MKADKTTEKEVIEVINRFVETYTHHDIEGTLALLAPDPDILLIGTGRDEKILGIEQARTQIKRDYEQGGDFLIKLGTTTVSSAGPVAWIAADSQWQVKIGGRKIDYYWRWTMVLEKRQNKWLIMQSHLSAPEASQVAGQSFPSK